MKTVISKCLGLKQLSLGAASVILGTGCAAYTGNIEPLSAMMCLLFVVSMQITLNVAYRYYDEKNGYGGNIDDGFGAEERGMPMLTLLREMYLSSALIAAMLGLTLAAMGGWLIILVDLAVIAGVYFCAASAAPASRAPYGILFQFMFYGPLAVLTTCYIQTNHEYISSVWSWELMGPAVWLSVAMGLLTVNIFLSEEFSSYFQDKRNDKRTFVAVFGRRRGRAMFLINGIGFYAFTWVFAADFFLPERSWMLVCPTVCFVWNLFIWLKLKPDAQQGMPGITRQTMWNALFYAISFLAVAIAVAPEGTTPRAFFFN